jgi:hypothetical protein
VKKILVAGSGSNNKKGTQQHTQSEVCSMLRKPILTSETKARSEWFTLHHGFLSRPHSLTSPPLSHRFRVSRSSSVTLPLNCWNLYFCPIVLFRAPFWNTRTHELFVINWINWNRIKGSHCEMSPRVSIFVKWQCIALPKWR